MKAVAAARGLPVRWVLVGLVLAGLMLAGGRGFRAGAQGGSNVELVGQIGGRP